MIEVQPGPATSRVVVGIDRSLEYSMPEVTYVFRTLLRVAGFGCRFVTVSDEAPEALDVYYGPAERAVRAAIRIDADGRSALAIREVDPDEYVELDGLPFLRFGSSKDRPYDRTDGGLRFRNDIVLASFWLLTGAAESRFSRDRWDNLQVGQSLFVTSALGTNPPVSRYALVLRRDLEAPGRRSRPMPWANGASRAAFAFSHDVDYPEIIKWIECLQLLRSRGLGGIPLARRVLRGETDFWRFQDWVDLAARYGTRNTFYFMAVRGSLVRYALGTPDAFYDIRSAAFRDLFKSLRDQGCEIGLHASFHAHRSADQLRREREILSEAAGVEVKGNRHHYWHLDPQAPHETIARHAESGLRYDSSLAFEQAPGFRRGICHPFRVYHLERRSELPIIELPPAWMDDHYDRRLEFNRIPDPDASARAILQAARETSGIAIVDYHVRGMNAEFFPKYGPWLADFLERNVDERTVFLTPSEIADQYEAYESAL